MAPWIPEELDADPAEDASYIVFEGPKFGMVNLVIATWPQVDDEGRLQWETEDLVSAVPIEELAMHDNIIAKNSYCYYVEGEPTEPSSWSKVVNVTRSAHEQASAAVQRAIDSRTH